MARVVLYIATSLDGYIADTNGGVDWLFTDGDYGYSSFLDSVDALIMGRRTFEQILGFEVDWPYPGKDTYVLSSADLQPHPQVQFVSEPLSPFVNKLVSKVENNVWLVGGADTISRFRQQDLIDEYILSVHPTLLGDGIPLFQPPLSSSQLLLVSNIAYPSGLVQLHYRVQRQS